MKPLKPGQLCTINNVVYRIKKRDSGCIGCSLNAIALCPNIVDRRFEQSPILCGKYGIILKRILDFLSWFKTL